LNRREVRVLSVLGLVLGLVLTLEGLTTMCNCPAQIVGQPSNCSCPASPEATVGLAVIIASAAALALSFLLRPRK